MVGKGIHVEVFIHRDDNLNISPELHEKIMRKVTALFKRMKCTPHGTWRLGDPPDVEDSIGLVAEESTSRSTE